MQNLTPIHLINPYDEWTICGMVTAKENMRFADDSPKKWFHFEVIDEEGGRIEIVAYDETADRLFRIVQRGSMYCISGGKVEKANRKFNSTGHDFQITMQDYRDILSCNDRQIVESPREYDVVPLASVGNAPHVDQCVDVIAIVEWIGDLEEVKKRTGVLMDKRDLMLEDESGMVEMTLWMEQARNWDTDLHQVVGIKGACHNIFKGKHTLSSRYSTRIEVNPDHENARALRARFPDNNYGIWP